VRSRLRFTADLRVSCVDYLSIGWDHRRSSAGSAVRRVASAVSGRRRDTGSRRERATPWPAAPDSVPPPPRRRSSQREREERGLLKERVGINQGKSDSTTHWTAAAARLTPPTLSSLHSKLALSVTKFERLALRVYCPRPFIAFLSCPVHWPSGV